MDNLQVFSTSISDSVVVRPVVKVGVLEPLDLSISRTNGSGSFGVHRVRLFLQRIF